MLERKFINGEPIPPKPKRPPKPQEPKRNAKCPCGSNKKYKSCCMHKREEQKEVQKRRYMHAQAYFRYGKDQMIEAVFQPLTVKDIRPEFKEKMEATIGQKHRWVAKMFLDKGIYAGQWGFQLYGPPSAQIGIVPECDLKEIKKA